MRARHVFLALFTSLLVGAVVSSCGGRTCSVTTCPQGCCDAAGLCQAPTQSACGHSGQTCQSCQATHRCDLGVCVSNSGAATGGGGGTDAGATDAGAPDAGRTHYPDGGPTSRYWDGGSCAVKTDCPCFSSDDCAPDFFCHAEDDTGLNVFCIAGARGAGLVGATCTGEADCFSGLCVDASDGGNGCSALCDDATECAPSLPRCRYVGFGIDRSLCGP